MSERKRTGPPPRTDIDVRAIEYDYRYTQKPLRQIARDAKVSHAYVYALAKKNNWIRDLTQQIRERAQQIVNERAALSPSSIGKLSETITIEANAKAQADVLSQHRRDIASFRKTITGMIEELGAASAPELQKALELILQEKQEAAYSEAAKTALQKAFTAAMSLASRSTSGRNLVTSLATLIDKERLSYGIDSESTGGGLEDALRAMDKPD